MKILLISYIVVLFLVCMPCPLTAAQDSSDSPAPQEFVTADRHQLTPEQQQWFIKFQEGNIFARGWKEISADILEKTPVELREKQRAALKALGIKIGYEWSKDNEIRKIDTRMLQEWGRLLKQTAGENPDQLKDVIVEIDRRVGRLLN